MMECDTSHTLRQITSLPLVHQLVKHIKTGDVPGFRRLFPRPGTLVGSEGYGLDKGRAAPAGCERNDGGCSSAWGAERDVRPERPYARLLDVVEVRLPRPLESLPCPPNAVHDTSAVSAIHNDCLPRPVQHPVAAETFKTLVRPSSQNLQNPGTSPDTSLDNLQNLPTSPGDTRP